MLKTTQIQFNPQVGKSASNFREVEILLSQATDAQLVILPELANSGYNFIDRKQALQLACEVEKSDYVEMIREKARTHNQHIVTGFHEMDGDQLFNSSLLISPDGHIGKYRKIHLFMHEKEIFSKGNCGLPVFKLGAYKIGMLICFDYLFPEVWRIMALKGADIIAHPSNLVTYKAFKVVPAQAIINRFFIFTTNRFGTERDITFSGRSFVVDPEGDVIGEAPVDQTNLLTAVIDPLLSRNKMITKKNHVLTDRYPEEYVDVLQQSIP